MSNNEELKLEELYENAIANFNGKIVVLDDDPTGTQTVHGIKVYTNWEEETLTKAFRGKEKMFYILTNSRSFSEEKTKKAHQEISENIGKVSKDTDTPFLIISRSDSTLRGHYPLETEILKEYLEKDMLDKVDGEVLCFSFFEGKRYTLDNIHYLEKDGKKVRVDETEFAQDQTFGFESSDLVEYVYEKKQGRIKKEDILIVSLDDLKLDKLVQLEEKLNSVKDFQQIIINAMNYEELKIFSIAILNVIKRGKKFIFRTAASLPKVLAGITDIPYLNKNQIVDTGNNNGGLTLIGSHVKLSTLQLKSLKESELPLTFVEFKVGTYFEENSFKAEINRIKSILNKKLSLGESVVVYTSRELLIPDSADKEAILSVSVDISKGLTEIVNSLIVRPKYVVSKGGITSSDIATFGLEIKEAQVLGQATAGVPVWLSDKDSKFGSTPYLIFPGNVGTTETLREVIETLEGVEK